MEVIEEKVEPAIIAIQFTEQGTSCKHSAHQKKGIHAKLKVVHGLHFPVIEQILYKE